MHGVYFLELKFDSAILYPPNAKSEDVTQDFVVGLGGINYCSAIPVSPTKCLPHDLPLGQLICGQCDAGLLGELSSEDIDHGNFIIGSHDGKRTPKPMKTPRELTPAEWAEHMVTHLPFCSGCPFCLAGKKPNQHHRKSSTPGFLRDSVSDSGVPFLVVYVEDIENVLLEVKT